MSNYEQLDQASNGSAGSTLRNNIQTERQRWPRLRAIRGMADAAHRLQQSQCDFDRFRRYALAAGDPSRESITMLFCVMSATACRAGR